MLNKEAVLAWDQVEHDLYEENGHVFGVELDLFNDHIYFYHRQDLVYTYLSNSNNDIYEAIEEFNQIVAELK